MANQALIDRLRRAHNIVRKLDHSGRYSTVAYKSAKQLQIIIRTAERNAALGHEQKAMEALEWAE